MTGLFIPLGTHAGVVHETLQPLGRTHIGAVHGDVSSVTGTPRWSREGVWGVLLRKKEQQRQCVVNRPQPPLPIPLCHSGEKVEKQGVKVKPKQKGGEGAGSSYNLFLFSHYPTVIWLVINSTFFSPQVQCLLSMTITGEWSLPVLISTHEPFIIFPLPCPAEEGEW